MSNGFPKPNCFEKAKAGGLFFIFSITKLSLKHECSSLPVTADAIRRQGLRYTPFQPYTNDKRCTNAHFSSTPLLLYSVCYRAFLIQITMLKVGTKVKVHHETHPFTGKIEQAMKWENPFSVFHKKGIDYVVRADDDNQLYKCPEKDVSKLSS